MRLRQKLRWVGAGLRLARTLGRQDPGTSLSLKYLSDFDLGTGPIQGGGDHAVLIDDDTFTGKDPFCRTESSPYVVHLSDCTLFPAKSIRELSDIFDPPAMGPAGRRGTDAFTRKPGNLIVTRDNELTCGSLTRDAAMPPIVRPTRQEGVWTADLPRVVDRIDEPVVFIDLLCAHFGHALIDTPSRLWYRLEPSLEHLRDLPMVAFGTHGLGSRIGMRRPSKWPSYLRLLLGALGIEPDRITVLTRPTRCRSVFIPKRLSPYWAQHGYSRRFLDTMQAAGDALAGGAEARGPHRLVYLSRSRLEKASRGLLDGQEQAVEEIFRRQGFEIVHPQLLSLTEQIRAVRGATHVAGCVGSQMHLMAFARNEGKRALRIAPSFFDTPMDRNILERGGGHFSGFVVDCDAPRGIKRDRVSWRMTGADLARLRLEVEAWLGETADRALAVG